MINIGIGIPFGQRSAGIDPQAKIAFDSLQSAGFTTPQGITGINAAFKTIKTIYGTSDITTAISFFGDPSLAYQIGAGSGTTLGQAIRTLPNIIDPTRATDAVQTTAASQPLLLTHTTGNNYYFQSGAAGNFIQSPNAAANQIIGTVDFDYCFEVQSNNTCSFGKINNNGGSPSYAGFINASNVVQYIDSSGSYRLIANVSSFLPSNGNLFWVRLTLSGTTATCFTSLDGETWTSRGTATATALTASNTATLTLSSGSMVSNPQKVYRMRIYNGLRDSGGTLVADCNPNQYNPSTSQTQWTSSTGEVWTINTGTATSGYKGVLVDRTIVQGDGIDDNIRATTLNISSTAATEYITRKKFTSVPSPNGFSILVELGANVNSNQGFLVDFNDGANTTFNAFNGGASNSSSFIDSSINLVLVTAQQNANEIGVNETLTYKINNTQLSRATNPSTGNNTSFNGTGLNLFSRNGTTTGAANCISSTIIITKIADTNTEQTGMYNYIKSINGNSF